MSCSQWTQNAVCMGANDCTWVNKGNGLGYCRDPKSEDEIRTIVNEDPNRKCSDEKDVDVCRSAVSQNGQLCVWHRGACVDNEDTKSIEDAIREYGMDQGGAIILANSLLTYYFTNGDTASVMRAIKSQDSRMGLEAVRQLALFLATLDTLSDADRDHLRQLAAAASDRIGALPVDPPTDPSVDDEEDDYDENDNEEPPAPLEDPNQQMYIAAGVLGGLLLLVVVALIIRSRRNKRQY